METLALPDLEVVPFDALDGSRIIDLESRSGTSSAVREGLPTSAFDALHEILGVSGAVLADALSISPRTLSRRRSAGRLGPSESDRLLRVARLTEMAIVALGSAESGARWMTAPHSLYGEPPLLHADTEPGARDIEDALYAVEFSAAA